MKIFHTQAVTWLQSIQNLLSEIKYRGEYLSTFIYSCVTMKPEFQNSFSLLFSIFNLTKLVHDLDGKKGSREPSGPHCALVASRWTFCARVFLENSHGLAIKIAWRRFATVARLHPLRRSPSAARRFVVRLPGLATSRILLFLNRARRKFPQNSLTRCRVHRPNITSCPCHPLFIGARKTR